MDADYYAEERRLLNEEYNNMNDASASDCSVHRLSCPKCGSNTGYKYMAKVEMQGEWGDQPESTGGGMINRTVKCIDCGHRVKRERAMNGGIRKGRSDE